MEQSLLPGEREIAQWNNISLSTHRLREFREGGGIVFVRSLVVSKIDWTELTRIHRPIFLVLAGLTLISGLALSQYPEGNLGIPPAYTLIASLLTSLTFIVSYWKTRSIALSFGSGEGRIRVSVPGKKTDLKEAISFLDSVESQVYMAPNASPPASVSAIARPGQPPTARAA